MGNLWMDAKAFRLGLDQLPLGASRKRMTNYQWDTPAYRPSNKI
jgi:hypothetical protein